MKESALPIKSKAFALDIIKVCNVIKQTKREAVLTNQLLRSGTSIGANIREAFYAHSRADFIAKLQIALNAYMHGRMMSGVLYCNIFGITAASSARFSTINNSFSPPKNLGEIQTGTHPSILINPIFIAHLKYAVPNTKQAMHSLIVSRIAYIVQ